MTRSSADASGGSHPFRRSVALLAVMRRNPSTIHPEVAEVFAAVEGQDSYRRTMLTRAIELLEALALRGISDRAELSQAYRAAALWYVSRMSPGSLRRWFEADLGRDTFIDEHDRDEDLLRNGYVREAVSIFELCVELAGVVQEELNAA